MSKSCLNNLSAEERNTEVFRLLKKRFNENDRSIFDAWYSVTENGKFKPEFIAWYERTRNVKTYQDEKDKVDDAELFNLNNVNSRTIVNDISKYIHRNNPSARDTINKNVTYDSLNYEDANDRSECIKFGGQHLLGCYQDYQEKHKSEKPKTQNFFVNQLINNYRTTLLNKIENAFGITKDELSKKLDINEIKDIQQEIEKAYNVKKGDKNYDIDTIKLLAITHELIRVVRDTLGNNTPRDIKNMLALIEELVDFTPIEQGSNIKKRDRLIDLMLSNQDTDVVRRLNKGGIGEDITDDNDGYLQKEQSSEAVDDGESTSESNEEKEEFDYSFTVFDGHDGHYPSYMVHLNDDVKSYLSTVPKLLSTNTIDGEYQYDLNNALGMESTHSLQELCVLLYTATNKENPERFVESIRQIAEQVSGMEGLISVYNDLQKNYDLAYALYTTFAKQVVSKSEVVRKEKELNTRISNDKASRTNSFRLQLFNDTTHSATSITKIDHNIFRTEINYDAKKGKIGEVGKLINDFKNSVRNKDLIDYTKDILAYNSSENKLEEDEDKIERKKDFTDIYFAKLRLVVDKLYDVVKIYYPSIDKSAVYNYVTTNVGENQSEPNHVLNITNIANVLLNTIDGAIKTKEAFDDRVSQKMEIRRNNNNLKEEFESERSFNPNAKAPNLADEDSVWKEPFITDSLVSATNGMAKLLQPYSVIKLDLNSSTVDNHLSSDVLNNCFISNLKQMLESELNREGNRNSPLNNYGRFKFQNKTYNFSNILIEKRLRDVNPNAPKEQGNPIVNRGLFEKSTNEFGNVIYVPTEYSTELLKFDLFSGIRDLDNGNSKLYSKMSDNDYLVTSLIYFQKSTHSSQLVEGLTFASYFLPTPSDAPKNYIMNSPKYSINDFIRPVDKLELQKAIDDHIKAVTKIRNTDFRKADEDSLEIEEHEFITLVTSGKLPSRYVSNSIKGKGNEIRIKYKNQEIIGTVDYTDKKKNYGEIKFEAFADYLDSKAKDVLKRHYEAGLLSHNIALVDGSYLRTIYNTAHPIYNQLMSIFLKEVSDCNIALTHLFEPNKTNTGFVQINNEKGKDGKPLNNHKNNIEWNKQTVGQYENPEEHCSQNYHKDENGKVYIQDENGVFHLKGKVFKSSKFTVGTKNFLEDMFAEGYGESEDGTIHALYGGNNTHIHTDENGNVILTPAQLAKAQECINNFIQAAIDSKVKTFNDMEHLLSDVSYDFYNIAEYALNYFIALENVTDLMLGNEKYYKNYNDIFKRVKELQGSGVPYALMDVTKSMIPVRTEVSKAYLNTQEVQDRLNKFGTLHDCKNYSHFYGVTVANSKRAPKTLPVLKETYEQVVLEDLKNNLRKAIELDVIDKSKESLSQAQIDEKVEKKLEKLLPQLKKRAQQKVETMTKSFSGIKVNDAQSYITFEEWIRRVAGRGQLDKYLPLIEKILDEKTPLDSNDIAQIAQIQVQKNFYYDETFDEELGTHRPRQIKNSEFVLIPRLLKGTDLEKVYNAMIAHGIDQLNTVETSKAGKRNIQKLWDNDGRLVDSWLNPENKTIESGKELYDYNYLYTQQETPQHMNTRNKAGIQLMKKSKDNINEDNPLYENKKEIEDMYCYNILDSFQSLMRTLGVPLNSDGTIKTVKDDRGNLKIAGIDAEVMCSFIKDEVIRRNMDSRMLDFVRLEDSPVVENTDIEFGLDTKIPLYANPSLSTKFENIVQAMFNNRITRQKLPGFHAAQVTSTGFISSEKVDKYILRKGYRNKNYPDNITPEKYNTLKPGERVRYQKVSGDVALSEELQYYPAKYKHKETGEIITEREYLKLSEDYDKDYEQDGASSVVEVIVPVSAFNLSRRDAKGNYKSDEDLLKELKDEGLDEIIGYRIPTEGKQSMAVMKIVGFVDEAYGSTIIVPDGWVAQTGSDFDIDSVYTMVPNNKLNDVTKKVEKVNYKIDNFDIYDYIDYIKRRCDEKVNSKIKDEIKELADYIDGMRDENSEHLNLLFSKRKRLLNQFSENYTNIINEAYKKAGEDNKGKSKSEIAIAKAQAAIDALQTYYEAHPNISEKNKDKVLQYIEQEEGIIDAINNNSKYSQMFKAGLENIKANRLARIESLAEKHGLLTYKEFLQLPTPAKNSKDARDNNLIDNMLTILKSDLSLQEKLATSKFTDITDVRDNIMPKSEKEKRKMRSPFDIEAQAANLEDAMSGRELKGISVQCDNTVSLCNNTKPFLTKNSKITIEYPFNESYNDAFVLELKHRFGKNNVTVDKQRKLIKVEHDKFGWSEDNKGITGDYITIYASEVTAHQLDIIKEGGVPNVNKETFRVYRMFPDIGSNYETAVSFMMQPIITKLVQFQNSRNSIYNKKYLNPFNETIKTIAESFGINTENKPISDIKKEIENKIPDFKKLKEEFVVLNSDLLTQRLNDENVGIDNKVFDYLVLLQYDKLRTIGDKINAISFVTNPDKFGAKQTMYDTSIVFDRIDEIIHDKYPVFEKVDGKHFLERLYPGVEKGVERYLAESDDSQSIYPSAHYFLKYASAASVVINRSLFITEHPNFREDIDRLLYSLNHNVKYLKPEVYNGFKKYIINYLYSNLDIITKPVAINKGKLEITDGNPMAEKRRIAGYGCSADLKIKDGNKFVEFKPIDLTYPTEEEIAKFSTYSPAQKVYFLQTRFSDSLVCDFLQVDLNVQKDWLRQKKGAQAITFKENSNSPDYIIEQFENMFYNDHPFVKLTALDLIKYATVVEGNNFKYGSINKIIGNSPLLQSLDSKGTGIVDSLKYRVQDFVKNNITEEHKRLVDSLVDSFIRSNSTMSDIASCYLDDEEIKKFERLPRGVLRIVPQRDNSQFLLDNNICYEDEVEYAPSDQKQLVPNKYVLIKGKFGKKTLYKTVNKDGRIYLYPLNILEANEYGAWSSNPKNNIYERATTYEAFIDALEDKEASEIDVKKLFDEIKQDAIKDRPENVAVVKSKEDGIVDVYGDDSPRQTLRKRIIDYFSNPLSGKLYLPNTYLNNTIKSFNSQVFELDGKLFRVRKVDVSKYNKAAKHKNNEELNEALKNAIPEFENYIRTTLNSSDFIQTTFEIEDISNEDEYFSTAVEETPLDTISKIDATIRRQTVHDESEEANQFHIDSTIDSKEAGNKTAEEQMEDMVINMRKFAETRVENIINGVGGLKYFVEDGTDYIPMTDPRVFEIMTSNKGAKVHRNYIKNLLEIKKLLADFEPFRHFVYDESNSHLKPHIDAILSKLDELLASPIYQLAEKEYVTNYLAKISNNPNIKNDIISLFDNFHETSYLAAHINDLQDSNNPIIQIATKTIMADIRAKDLQGKEVIRKFKEQVSALQAEAKKHGLNINFDNIINDEGMFVQEYNAQFEEDLKTLEKGKREAYSAYLSFTGDEYDKAQLFNTYLKAKRKYELFLTKNVNREVADGFYVGKLALDERFIKEDGNYEDVYVAYKMLVDQKYRLLNKVTDSEEISGSEREKRLEEIETKIHALKSNYYQTADGLWHEKHDYEPYTLSSDPKTRRLQNMYSASSADKITDYTRENSKLYSTYYDTDEKFAFRETLENCLTTINKYEQVDPNTGLPTRTKESLEKEKDYMQAKLWLRKNAIKSIYLDKETIKRYKAQNRDWFKDYLDGKIPEDSREFRYLIHLAQEYFSKNRGEGSNRRAAYRVIGEKYKDSDGYIDATQMSEKEIEVIRQDELAKYGIGRNSQFNEKNIIHNGLDDGILYTSAFYKGMQVGGATNKDYLALVSKINTILSRGFIRSTKTLDTTLLDATDLKNLLDLFEELGYNQYSGEFDRKNKVNKHVGVRKKRVKEVQKFIDENVDFVITPEEQAEFDRQKAIVEATGDDNLIQLWLKVNQEWTDDKGFVPNHLLWGHAKPKDAVKDKFTDYQKTAAIKILNSTYVTRPTKYYENKLNEMIKRYGVESAEYRDWYNKNHVYNPYSHRYEPLPCWTTSRYNDNIDADWIPNGNMRVSKVKDEYANPFHKEGMSERANYKSKAQRERIKQYNEDTYFSETPEGNSHIETIPDTSYDSDVQANEYELEMKKLFQEMLYKLAQNKKAKQRVEEGYMALRSKSEKSNKEVIISEFLKLWGIDKGGRTTWDGSDKVDYGMDYIPNMPMMSDLKGKHTEYPPKLSDFPNTPEGKEKYKKAVDDYNARKEEIDKKNREIHKSLIDKNWVSVMEDFIEKATHYNALQDNKYQLYYIKNLLEDISRYKTKHGKLIIDERKSTPDNVEYVKEGNTAVIDQYNNWVMRLLFDLYKVDKGKYTTAANIMQSITSTSFMTMNIRGGIANITVGESSMLAEAFASQYFGHKDLQIANARYGAGLMSYFAGAMDETSSSLQDAIIKGMEIVDYDMLNGVVTQIPLEKWTERVRNFTYSPNNMGEHKMQNTAMFAMMESHRLVPNPKTNSYGTAKYVLMNFNEYLENIRIETLLQVLTESQKQEFQEWLKRIKQNPELGIDFAWYKKEPVSQFLMKRCTKDQRKEFDKKIKENKKLKKEEFEKNPTLYSQLELGSDKKLAFKADSLLNEMNHLEDGQEVTDAYKLMGEFKGRCISVNKKIHGNYGKLDSARIEKFGWGRLLMQYHKHIPTGIAKRYRKQGYFNEERGTIEKGSYISILDFLSMPIKMIEEGRELDGETKETIKGLQKVAAYAVDYFRYLKMYKGVMPEYEIQNMNRIAGNLCGIALAIGLAILAHMGWDDDDESLAYNLLIYETDRLATEASEFFPIGGYGQLKKLISSPVAAQTLVQDALNIFGTCFGVIVQGEDYNPYFETGRYAGKLKGWVYFERRLPYWRNWVALRDLGESNHYYKLGDNALSFVPVKAIGERFRE